MSDVDIGRVAVSVVMGCYNCADRIADTVRSLQQQSLQTWELIVIDDGSTDGTGDILDLLAASDSRLQVIHQGNAGLTRALIRGCDLAQGVFIARQDAGDRSRPLRLHVQKAYLEAHPDVVAVGSGVRLIGPNDEFLGEWVRSAEPQEIANDLTERSVGFVHPSVMFRRDAYRAAGGYRVQFLFAQDHDLWYRLAQIGKLGTCREVLFEFRQDIVGVSPENREVQQNLGALARDCFLARSQGQSELPFLAQAAQLSERKRPTSPHVKMQARGAAAYFVGSQLFHRRDPRCRRYFAIAIQTWANPVRSLLKYFVSIFFLRDRQTPYDSEKAR